MLRENGAITTDLIWNGHLCIANLQEHYWKWWRSLNRGIMNDTIQDMTQKNIVLQNDIVTTTCNQFNPYLLVRTDYGDGSVEQAELTLKDKRLTLSLSY